MPEPKYTREDVQKQLADLRSTVEGMIKCLDRVFDTAFELDWNSTLFAVSDETLAKNPKVKKAVEKKDKKVAKQKEKKEAKKKVVFAPSDNTPDIEFETLSN